MGSSILNVPAERVHDAFISFSRRDEAALVPIVAELRKRKINVWWCPDIDEGRWDKIIEEKVRSSRRVLAFITTSVDESPNDFVFAELELARTTSMLIPVVIGDAGKTYQVRAVTARQQTYFFTSLDQVLETPTFEKLVRVCGGQALRPEPEPQLPPSADQRVEAWFSLIEQNYGLAAQHELFALALAIAVFESGPLVDVERVGRMLVESLGTAEPLGEDKLDVGFPRRRAPLMAILDCEAFEALHPVLGATQTIVRFKDPERAIAFIQFAWREFGSRRAVIHDWFTAVAEQANPEGCMRLGLALGTLAQGSFVDVFDQILRPWLLSAVERLRTVGDIALSVAAFDPVAANAVRNRIAAWVDQGSDTERLCAVRLACGFAGARLPGVPIATLRRAAVTAVNDSSERWPLIETMEESMRGLLRMHHDNMDNSLFDLSGLIEGLAVWAGEDQQLTALGEATDVASENPYPVLLFLLALTNLPITQQGRVRGELSLEALMSQPSGTSANQGGLVHSTAEQTARVFNKALARPKIGKVQTRMIAQRILRDWIAARQRERDDVPASRHVLLTATHDPLLTFARILVKTAHTDYDVDRIAYLFDSVFTRDDLHIHTNHDVVP